MEPETTNFDLIVVGTGVPESIFAGAAASAGKKVCLLDEQDHYGSLWASFTLDDFQAWLLSAGVEGQHESAVAASKDACAADVAPPQPQIAADMAPPQPQTSTTDDSGNDACDQESCDDPLGAVTPHVPGAYSGVAAYFRRDASDPGPSREYNIDLAPKLLYNTGPMIELLLASGAHNYMEFKLVQGAYLWRDNAALPIPADRADIFNHAALSLGERRALWRFISLLQAAEKGTGELAGMLDTRPFAEVTSAAKLSTGLRDLLLYGLAQADDESLSAEEAIARFKVHTASAGHFAVGTGAFLAPCYGAGDVSQAFCRAAAVGGALCMLRTPVSRIAPTGEGPAPPESASHAADSTTDAAAADDSATRAERTEGAAGDPDETLENPAGDPDETLDSGKPDETPTKATDESSQPKPDPPRRFAVTLHDGRELRADIVACHAHVRAATACCSASDGMETGPRVSRAAVLTDAPLQDDSSLLMVLPPGSFSTHGGGTNRTAVRVVQQGLPTHVAPKGRYLVQLSCLAVAGCAEDDLRGAVELLLNVPDASSSHGLGSSAVPATMGRADDKEEAREASTERGSCAADPHAAASSDAAARTVAEPSASGEMEPCAPAEGDAAHTDWRPKAQVMCFFQQELSSPPAASRPEGLVILPSPDQSVEYASVLSATSAAYRECYDAELFPPKEEEATSQGGSDSDNDLSAWESALSELTAPATSSEAASPAATAEAAPAAGPADAAAAEGAAQGEAEAEEDPEVAAMEAALKAMGV